jgi:hypothetical protein
MKKPDPFTEPDEESIASFVNANAPKVRRAIEMKMSRSQMQSVRQTDYKGHRIVVKTTYAVEVDGRPFMANLGVSNSGQVHYHGIPNMAFDSAIDLVKKAIDIFPTDFVDKPSVGSMPGMPGRKKEKMLTGHTAKTARKRR